MSAKTTVIILDWKQLSEDTLLTIQQGLAQIGVQLSCAETDGDTLFLVASTEPLNAGQVAIVCEDFMDSES